MYDMLNESLLSGTYYTYISNRRCQHSSSSDL